MPATASILDHFHKIVMTPKYCVLEMPKHATWQKKKQTLSKKKKSINTPKASHSPIAHPGLTFNSITFGSF